MMRVYLHNCPGGRSNVLCGFSFTVVRLVNGKLMYSGFGTYETTFKELMLPGECDEMVWCVDCVLIKLKDGRLMKGLSAPGVTGTTFELMAVEGCNLLHFA